MKTRLTRFSLASVVALSLLFAPLTAAAKNSKQLLRYLPSSSKVVLGINVSSLRGSYLFGELTKFLKEQDVGEDVLGFLLEGVGLDLSKDIEAATMGQENPTMSPADAQNSDASFIVSAKFDEKKVIAAAKKMYGDVSTAKNGELTIYDAGKFKFAFPAKDVIVFSPDAGSYEAATWKAVVNEKAAATSNDRLVGLTKQANTGRGLWLAALTDSLPSKGPTMNSAVMSLGASGGLQVEIHSNMADEAGAKKSETQLSGLAKSGNQNAMVMMVGAGPLVQNLSVVRKGKTVSLTTSMTEPQLRTLVQKLKAVSQQQAPIPGSVPGSGKTPSTAPPSKAGEAPEGGVEADFN